MPDELFQRQAIYGRFIDLADRLQRRLSKRRGCGGDFGFCAWVI